jgi:hypothetical protein
MNADNGWKTISYHALVREEVRERPAAALRLLDAMKTDGWRVTACGHGRPRVTATRAGSTVEATGATLRDAIVTLYLRTMR